MSAIPNQVLLFERPFHHFEIFPRENRTPMMNQQMQVTLTCPHCQATELILVDTSDSKQFHQCCHCHKPYGASKNDCCILCSYGDTPCSLVDQNLAS